MPTFEDYRKIWAANTQSGRHETPVRSLHAVSGPKFIKELRHLSSTTDDLRFSEATRALRDNNLIDGCSNWRRPSGGSKHTFVSSAQQQIIAAKVSELLELGTSKRSAFAKVAADQTVPAATFEGAVRRVERIWQAFRANLEKERPSELHFKLEKSRWHGSSVDDLCKWLKHLQVSHPTTTLVMKGWR